MKISFRLFTFALTALALLPMSAIVNKSFESRSFVVPKILKNADQVELKEPRACVTYAPERRAAEEGTKHKIKIKIEIDSQKFWQPWGCRVVNADNSYSIDIDSDGWGEEEVQEGTYMVYCNFDSIDNSVMFGQGPQYFVVLEDVDITEDREVVLNPETATVEIATKPVLPSGEIMKLGHYEYDEEVDHMVYVSGNINKMLISNVLSYSGIGMVCGDNKLYEYEHERFDPYRRSTIYITPCSERLTILRCVCAYDEINGYYVTTSAPLHTDFSNFEFCDDYSLSWKIESDHTELYQSMPSDIEWPSTTASISPDFGSTSVYPLSGYSKSDIISGAGLENVKDFINIYVNAGVVDFGAVDYVTGSDGTEQLQPQFWVISLPPFSLSSEVPDYVIGVNPTPFYSASWDSPNPSPIESYSFSASDTKMPFASSQPTHSLGWKDFYEWSYDEQIDDLVVNHSRRLIGSINGRLGENYESFYPVTSYMVTTLDSDKSWFDPERTDESRVEVSFDISHLEIDGLLGHTTGKVYWDERSEDKNPPVITMMQFRNNANEVTDRFDNAEQGYMIISGGDFNEELSGSEESPTVNFVEEDADLKVEWRPTGVSDSEWTAFDLKLVDEDRPQGGFGPLRQTSLQSVSAYSPTSWYDVKITITDKAGNYSEQVVSPAFRISESSSVETILKDENVEAIYDLQGRKVSRPVKGIYLVKRNGQYFKETIR